MHYTRFMQKNKEDIRQVSKISHYREVKNASRPFYHLLQSLFCDLYRIFLIVNTITSLLPHFTPPLPFPASSSGSAPAYSTALHTAVIASTVRRVFPLQQPFRYSSR